MKKTSTSTTRRICVLMAIIMLLPIFSVTAFAAGSEETSAQPKVTTHTTTFEVAAGETIGISPALWNSYSVVNLAGGTSYNGPSFTMVDNYIAFEVTGYNSSGNTTSTKYTVSLVRSVSGATIAAINAPADGVTYKKDWLSIAKDYDYYFKFTNHGSEGLRITIVYYTWN